MSLESCSFGFHLSPEVLSLGANLSHPQAPQIVLGAKIVVHRGLNLLHKVHEFVDLVDEGDGASAWGFEAEVAALSPVIGFELDFGTAACFFCVLGWVVLFGFVAGCSFARLGEEVVLVDEGGVGEVAR